MTFLVDVNLPKFLSQYTKDEFIFVLDINKELSDTKIWELAVKNNYIILTRDMDFFYKARQSIRFPKIIIFRFGNIKLKEMREYFDRNWNSICDLIIENNLLFAWQKEIEIIY
jgi:predicted nuclease of predicted toxin-antitoxin system